MALTQMRNSLWTPNGPVDLQQKDVTAISLHELRVMSYLHEMAQKYKWTLICQKCDHSIEGRNNDSVPQPAVSCRCTEWRYTR